MNAVLLNHFRRWWLLFAILAVFQMAMVGPTLMSKRTTVLFFPAFAGPFLLLRDCQRGLMRALAPLPVSRRDMATGWWLATVPLPAIITVALLLAGQFAYSFVTPKAVFDPRWLMLHGVLSFVLCGAMYYAFAGMGQGYPTDWYGRIRTTFSGILWGLSGGCIMIYSMSSQPEEIMTDGYGLFLIPLAAFATWRSWTIRESVVEQKSSNLTGQSGSIPHADPRTFKIRRERGGIAFMITNMLRSYVFFFTILVGGFAILGAIMHMKSAPLNLRDLARHLLTGQNPGALGIWLTVNAVSLAPLMQIRGLRMLPMRPATITGLLIGLPICFSLLTAFLLFGLTHVAADGVTISMVWDRAAQSMVIFSVAVPMLLRWGFSPVSLGTLFTLIPLITILTIPSINLVPRHLFLPMALLAGVPLCVWVTHRQVLLGNAPYRGQLMNMPGW